MSRKFQHDKSPKPRESTSTAIALGVHYLDSRFMLQRNFKDIAERLNAELNVSSQWIGIPYPQIQDDDESHLRFGVIVRATMRSGHVKGWLRKIHRVGADVALYCAEDARQQWSLVSLGEGAFEEMSYIGEFQISKIHTLTDILMTQAPTRIGIDQSHYIPIPNTSTVEMCHAPERGFFSSAHLRYIQRRRATQIPKL
jgi:hypothetical protein